MGSGGTCPRNIMSSVRTMRKHVRKSSLTGVESLDGFLQEVPLLNSSVRLDRRLKK